MTGVDVVTIAADESTYAAMDKVSGFTAALTDAAHGGDTITFSAFSAVAGDTAASVDITGAIADTGTGFVANADIVDGFIVLSGANSGLINTLAEWKGVFDALVTNLDIAAGETAAFKFGGNTYVVTDISGGATADEYIELTGLVSATVVSATAGANTICVA